MSEYNNLNRMLLGFNIFGDKITGIKYANTIGANFIQIFLKSPRSYVTFQLSNILPNVGKYFTASN